MNLISVGIQKENSDNYLLLITRECKFGGLPVARDAFVQMQTVNDIHCFSPVFSFKND